MRRIKLVLAAAALMVAMLMAFSAPAMADKGDHNGKNNTGAHNNFEPFDHNNFDDFGDGRFFANGGPTSGVDIKGVDIKWIMFFTDLFS